MGVLTAGLVSVLAALLGGAAGWWGRGFGERRRRTAADAYHREQVRVAEKARDRARAEASDFETRYRRMRAGDGEEAPSEAALAAEQSRHRLTELRAEMGRLQSKLRDRDAALARNRAELDSKNAILAQMNGRGEVAKLKAELSRLRDQSRVATPLPANGNGNGNGNGRPAPDTEPRWLVRAEDAPLEGRDDLQRIRGLGPRLEEGLNRIGVFYYRQLASMTREEIDWLAPKLKVFPGRIVKDDWVGQARAMGPDQSAPDHSR